jgi:aerobic-type carbon monoxide dehydrogenase small subunit (CoxS/CutS family)
MTNRNDLFDEPEDKQPVQDQPPPAESPPQASSSPSSGAPAASQPPRPLDQNLSRRRFLRGASAAAVGGAVVGAAAAVGIGALGGDDGGGAVTELDGMTLGAPEGRVLNEAVVRLNVNGADRWVRVGSSETLAEVLRRTLGLTGTKIGCDRSECSACTVMVNGVAQNSCSLLAIREDGREIVTIEGLSKDGELSAVQQAFLDNMGLQCGFCTPGQIVQATALLQRNAKPSEAEIRRAMSGNLCKCSAYPNILTAIQKAAEKGIG